MLLLGHVGIALGAAVLLDSIISKNRPYIATRYNAVEHSRSPSESVAAHESTSSPNSSVFKSLANHMDIRILFIGAILPDIVDKPIGQYFLRDTFSTGRIYCHTLLFAVILLLAGLYLYRSRKKTWLLVLSFGTFIHLILDQMWFNTRTFLWPLYGFTFERKDLTDWTLEMFRRLVSDPQVYVLEIIGAAVLIWFIVTLARNKTFYAFIKNGIVL